MKWNVSLCASAMFAAFASCPVYADASAASVITNFDDFPLTAYPGAALIEHDGFTITETTSWLSLRIDDASIPGGSIKGRWLNITPTSKPALVVLKLPDQTKVKSLSFEFASQFEGSDKVGVTCKYANGAESTEVLLPFGHAKELCAHVRGTTVAALQFRLPNGNGSRRLSIDNLVSP